MTVFPASMNEDAPSRADWRDWYRMTSVDRLMEGLSEQADLAPGFSRETFLDWRRPRTGTDNPSRMRSPVWEWFVTTGLSAYAGNCKFDGPSSFDIEPCWCNDRLGQTAVDLPDGRLVLVAGEHEDSYDSDFFIYNDVIALHNDGGVEIYGFPREIFPPTDFHTSTLTGDRMVIIGNLGYPEDRIVGHTQIFILNVQTFAMSRICATGECPGWISKHTAELAADGKSISVTGGEVWRAVNSLVENLDEWKLHLNDWRWERLTRRPWPRWSLERSDGGRLHLWEFSRLIWKRRVKWETEEAEASLRDSLNGEPDEKAYESLFRPPVTTALPVEDPDDSRVVRVVVDNITVRFNDKGGKVVITIEGTLPAEITDIIVEDCRSKLERVERSSVRAIRIAD